MTHPTAATIAFDPSSTGYSFGVIRPDGNRYTIITSGTRTPATYAEARAHAHELHATYPGALWAVETTAGFLSEARINRQRTKNFDLTDLIQNATWGGYLIGCAPDPGAVITLPANAEGKRPSWRLYLTGYARADDKAVTHSLNYWLKGGLPVRGRNAHGQPVSYAINEHQRDAVGLAVAVNAKLINQNAPQPASKKRTLTP